MAIRALALTLVLLASAALTSGILANAPISSTGRVSVQGLAPHPPILIQGDSGFTSTSGVIGGGGTPGDPYVIAGWQIDEAGGFAIEVLNTTASFVLRDIDIVNSAVAPPYPYAAYFVNVTHARMEHVNVSSGSLGFRIIASSDVTLTSVNQDSPAGVDLWLSASENVTVADSRFNGTGLDIESSRNITISSNQLVGVQPGGAVVVLDSTDATVDGNVMVQGEIVFNYTWNSTISHNRLGKGWILVGFAQSFNTTIVGNDLGGLDYGIDAGGQDLIISGNNISSVASYGLVVGAERALVVGNRISDSGRGIQVQASNGTSVYRNDLVNNTIQAVVLSSINTSWNASYPTGGNYWSDYTGVDQCSGTLQDNCTGPDGIGDTPYTIGPSNLDRYPLMAFVGKDTSPPTVVITSPSEGATFASSSITVSGTAFDAGGSGLRDVQVRANGGAWGVAAGFAAWTASVALTQGVNRIEAAARDWAGNSALAVVNVTYVLAPPPPNTPPYANFSWTPATGNTSTVFTFNSSSWDSQDPPSALQVRWDWETDGVWDTTWSTDGTATHRFTSAAVYNVTMEVMDSGGLTSNRTFRVTVSTPSPPLPPPLRAVITATPSSGTMPLTVTFASTVTGGVAPFTYDWHLGDGATTTAADTVHIYLTGGNFTVWLTVYDRQSANAVSNSLWVNVTAAAVNLSVIPILPTEFTSSSNGITVTLAASVSGGTPPYTFLWVFGDGTTGTTATPVHTYPRSGLYNVTLTVTDSQGISVRRSFDLLIPIHSTAVLVFPVFLFALIAVACTVTVAVAIYLVLRARKSPPTS